MAIIITFPTKHRQLKTGAARVSRFAARPHPSRTPAQEAARTFDESVLSPYYGSPDPTSKMVPFFAYADLSVTGHTSSITLPDKTHYYLDHPRDAQDLLWAAQLSAGVITEAHWSGDRDNPPWRGLLDAIDYARCRIFDICSRLQAGGCDTRILENLPIKLHARTLADAVSRTELALCFTARRRIEIVRRGRSAKRAPDAPIL